MDGSKEEWEDVIQSMKGSNRAAPRPELFSIIQDKITSSEFRGITRSHWLYATAAASIILLGNIMVLQYYSRPNEVYENVVVGDDYSQNLISTYQIYE